MRPGSVTTSKDKVDRNMENEILKETVGMIVDAFGSDLEMITIDRAVFGLFFSGSLMRMRPPKPMTRPVRLWMGNITRPW